MTIKNNDTHTFSETTQFSYDTDFLPLALQQLIDAQSQRQATIIMSFFLDLVTLFINSLHRVACYSKHSQLYLDIVYFYTDNTHSLDALFFQVGSFLSQWLPPQWPLSAQPLSPLQGLQSQFLQLLVYGIKRIFMNVTTACIHTNYIYLQLVV